MKDTRDEHAEKVALFRYGLIADLLQPAAEDGRKLYERLKEKAGKTYCIPASRRTTVAVETLRDWISLYKAGGFDALKPKPRKDIGSARAIPPEVIDLLVSTKDEHRDFSVSMVIDEVKKQNETARSIDLPTSTIHRVLSRAGVMAKQIRNEVTRLSSETRTRPVLILDEAHALRSEVLEEMRLLTNYAMDSQNRLCLLFCGQTELRRRLTMAVHEPLAQRIVVRYQLGPLAGDELGDYLRHLLRLAGTELPLFEPAAVEAIYQASQGVPRRVNGIAHHTLIAAALAKAKAASVDHVQAALAEVA